MPDSARLTWEGSRLAGLLLGLLAAGGLLFSKLAEDVAGGEWIVSFDKTVAVSLHAHATDFATAALNAVTSLGGAHALLAVTLVTAVWLLRQRRVAHAALMVMALAGGDWLNSLLKATFDRPRPSFSEPIATAAGFSFPSGHAMSSLTVYGALAFVIAARVKSPRARLLAVVAAVALVVAIGFSRVYLGVHYVSDVLAGYSAGLAWLTVCALVLLAGLRLRAGRSGCTGVGSGCTATPESNV
jgi:membrane-associated phospholipid phosphatase